MEGLSSTVRRRPSAGNHTEGPQPQIGRDFFIDPRVRENAHNGSVSANVEIDKAYLAEQERLAKLDEATRRVTSAGQGSLGGGSNGGVPGGKSHGRKIGT